MNKKKRTYLELEAQIRLEFLFVHFVRDAGLLQLVGGLVVCWNELAICGQGE